MDCRRCVNCVTDTSDAEIALDARGLLRPLRLLVLPRQPDAALRGNRAAEARQSMDFATVSYYNKCVCLVFALLIAELASMEKAPVLTVSRVASHSPPDAQWERRR